MMIFKSKCASNSYLQSMYFSGIMFSLASSVIIWAATQKEVMVGLAIKHICLIYEMRISFCQDWNYQVFSAISKMRKSYPGSKSTWIELLDIFAGRSRIITSPSSSSVTSQMRAWRRLRFLRRPRLVTWCPSSPKAALSQSDKQSSWQYDNGRDWRDGDIKVTCRKHRHRNN